MYGYIYETTCLVNNHKYIGKHKSTEFDYNYKGSGVALKRAINKYGKDVFTTIVLEECNSLEELNEAEKKWIEYYDAVKSKKYYNIALGGDGGQDISGDKNPNWHKGRFGESNGMYGKGYLVSGSNNGMYHKKHTDEARKKMSENYVYTEKMKEVLTARKGTNNPNAKKIMCVELNKVFNTIKEAQAFINRPNARFNRYIKNNKKYCGYSWRYI